MRWRDPGVGVGLSVVAIGAGLAAGLFLDGRSRAGVPVPWVGWALAVLGCYALATAVRDLRARRGRGPATPARGREPDVLPDDEREGAALLEGALQLSAARLWLWLGIGFVLAIAAAVDGALS